MTMDHATNNTTTVERESSQSGLALGLLVLLCPVMLLAVAGNLLVLISYVRDARLRSVHNWYIFNLASADFLIGCFSMPLYVMYTLQHQTWTLGKTFCKVFITVDNTLCLETVLLIILISWDRLLLLRCGLDYRVKVSMAGAYIRVAVSWVMAFALHGPANLAWTAVTGYSAIPDKECDTEFFNNFAFTLATSLIEFVLSFLLLAIINSSLYLRIRERKLLGRTRSPLPEHASLCYCKSNSHAFSHNTSGILKRIINVHESNANRETVSKIPSLRRSEGGNTSQAVAHSISTSEWSRQSRTRAGENALVKTQTNGERFCSPELENVCDENVLTTSAESTDAVTGQKDAETSHRNSSSSAVCTKFSWYYEDTDDNDNDDDPWEQSASCDEHKGQNDNNCDISPNGEPLTSDQDSKCIHGINNIPDNQNLAMLHQVPNEIGADRPESEDSMDTSNLGSDDPKTDDHSKTTPACTADPTIVLCVKTSSAEEGGMSLVSPSMSSAVCTCIKRVRSKSRRDLKAAKALLALVLIFLLTWGPYTVVTIVNSACSVCIQSEVVDVFTWLLWSKSALNPLLYAFHSPRFRQNFRLLLSCAFSRCRYATRRQ